MRREQRGREAEGSRVARVRLDQGVRAREQARAAARARGVSKSSIAPRLPALRSAKERLAPLTGANGGSRREAAPRRLEAHDLGAQIREQAGAQLRLLVGGSTTKRPASGFKTPPSSLRGRAPVSRMALSYGGTETAGTMTTSTPDLPPYAPQRLLSAPFPERVRLLCRAWASQMSPNSKIVMAIYWAKYLLVFIGGWAFWVSFSKGYPGLFSTGWIFSDVAFQKFVVWAIAYEMLGLGCWVGPDERAHQSAHGRLPALPAAGHHQAPALPGHPGLRRHPARLARRGALRREPSCCCVRALVAPEITPDAALAELPA